MNDELTLAVKIAYSDILAAEEDLALIEERKKEAENRVRAARRAFLSLLNANHEGKK